MEREHSDSDDPSPCGHHNPRTSHFCDVCGVKLPASCPRCHAVNRGGANFCSECGIDLRAVGTEPLPAPRESGRATLSETAAGSQPKSVDQLLRLERGDTPVEDEPGDAERLERLLRFQRSRRRSWASLGPVSVVAVASLLIAALIHTHLATPSRDEHLRAGLMQPSAGMRAGPNRVTVASARIIRRRAHCPLPRRRRRRPAHRPSLARGRVDVRGPGRTAFL